MSRAGARPYAAAHRGRVPAGDLADHRLDRSAASPRGGHRAVHFGARRRRARLAHAAHHRGGCVEPKSSPSDRACPRDAGRARWYPLSASRVALRGVGAGYGSGSAGFPAQSRAPPGPSLPRFRLGLAPAGFRPTERAVAGGAAASRGCPAVPPQWVCRHSPPPASRCRLRAALRHCPVRRRRLAVGPRPAAGDAGGDDCAAAGSAAAPMRPPVGLRRRPPRRAPAARLPQAAPRPQQSRRKPPSRPACAGAGVAAAAAHRHARGLPALAHPRRSRLSRFRARERLPRFRAMLRERRAAATDRSARAVRSRRRGWSRSSPRPSLDCHALPARRRQIQLTPPTLSSARNQGKRRRGSTGDVRHRPAGRARHRLQ